MEDYLDFYSLFDSGEMIPQISISVRSSDKYENFKEFNTTYDMLSYKYYGNSLNSRIISMANPQFNNELEEIPDGIVIRIPFPFDAVKQEIISKVNLYKKL